MNTMLYAYLNLKNFFAGEEGQDLVEYALLLGLIAIAAVLSITAAGGSVAAFWTTIEGALDGVSVTTGGT